MASVSPPAAPAPSSTMASVSPPASASSSSTIASVSPIGAAIGSESSVGRSVVWAAEVSTAATFVGVGVLGSGSSPHAANKAAKIRADRTNRRSLPLAVKNAIVIGILILDWMVNLRGPDCEFLNDSFRKRDRKLVINRRQNQHPLASNQPVLKARPMAGCSF